jgi:hypothetical protein
MKVILSTREPGRWYTSITSSVYRFYRLHLESTTIACLLKILDPRRGSGRSRSPSSFLEQESILILGAGIHPHSSYWEQESILIVGTGVHLHFSRRGSSSFW